MVGFPSGQREQTVNLSSYDFGGSNPPPTTSHFRHRALSGYLTQLHLAVGDRLLSGYYGLAGIAQRLEHQPSKLRVAGSNPVSRSIPVKNSPSSPIRTSCQCTFPGEQGLNAGIAGIREYYPNRNQIYSQGE